MTDLVKTIDPWFINLLVIVLTAYFLWSIKGLFSDLRESISDLKRLVADLDLRRNDHEMRIIALETKCVWEHGESNYNPTRQSGGRRLYDPKEPVVTQL